LLSAVVSDRALDASLSAYEILESIAALTDPEDPVALARLETALDSLPPTEAPEAIVFSLFKLLERFPTSDGLGVFWSVLHYLEATPRHEACLVASINRCPTEFGVLMVNRILNVPGTELEPWLSTLRRVERLPAEPDAIRQLARKFIARHTPQVPAERPSGT
jgi:hypothetical protein